MGARIPPSERPRRGGIKCEFCGRAVPSEAALHSHQTSLHSQALKEKAKQKTTPAKSLKLQKSEQKKESTITAKPKGAVPETKETPKKVPSNQSILKTALEKPHTDTPRPKTVLKLKADTAGPKPETPRPKVTPKLKTYLKKDKTEKILLTEPTVSKLLIMEKKKQPSSSTPTKVRKQEYQCPECEKLFPVLFVAQKHIQNKHHSTRGDSKGSRNPLNVIKPILLELCIYCNEKFSKPHDCPNRPDANLLSYDCTGCEQQFKSNKLFDMHVADVHGDQIESMFFLTDAEFTAWKEEMEYQTECQFVLVGRYNKKQVYRCCENTDNNDEDNIQLCPSTIVASKCAKGMQVNFYPCHYSHEYKKYELKDLYKTFSITDLIQQAGDNKLGSDDTDLYLQFKTLMDSIVFDAAKINIDMLKRLYEKATDMMAVLKEYDEDEEMDTISNRSTLSINTSNRGGDVSTTLMQTRTRKRGIEENGTAEKKLKTSEDTKILVRSEQYSILAEKKLKTSEDTKILIKPSVKKPSTFSLADDKDTEKILQELDSENVKDNKISTQSQSFNDTYKDFIKNNVLIKGVKGAPGLKPNSKTKKNIVKTKMGQFKPSLSPKKEVKVKQISTSSTGKATDVEYEVREQENDVNILVLKI